MFLGSYAWRVWLKREVDPCVLGKATIQIEGRHSCYLIIVCSLAPWVWVWVYRIVAGLTSRYHLDMLGFERFHPT